MSRQKSFDTVDAIDRLMSSMEVAINNMIDEVRRPVDPEASGAGRKAELQSVKQTAVDCQDLIKKYQELTDMKKELQSTGGMKEEKDYRAGFAEKFSK
jgi:hypothetical protein